MELFEFSRAMARVQGEEIVGKCEHEPDCLPLLEYEDEGNYRIGFKFSCNRCGRKITRWYRWDRDEED